MKTALNATLLALTLAFGSAHAADAKPLASDAGTPAVMAGDVVRAEAEVVGIDKKTRTVTLKGEDGNVFDVVVGKEAKNFKQIKVGDRVVAEHMEVLAMELKKGGGLRETVEKDIDETAKPGQRPGAIRGARSPSSPTSNLSTPRPAPTPSSAPGAMCTSCTSRIRRSWPRSRKATRSRAPMSWRPESPLSRPRPRPRSKPLPRRREGCPKRQPFLCVRRSASPATAAVSGPGGNCPSQRRNGPYSGDPRARAMRDGLPAPGVSAFSRTGSRRRAAARWCRRWCTGSRPGPSTLP